MIKYEVLHVCKQSGARLGKLTINGIEHLTPIFMPVGTNSTVKGLSPEEIDLVSDKLILANTYHNWLQPGADVIDKFGSIKKFMHWDGNMLTDSGGFQVFSLSKTRKITESGINFKSIINGDDLFLSPESCIKLQETFGADIIMVLDECPPVTEDLTYLKDSVDRTIRWAKRCKDSLTTDQALFGIVQGGLDIDLRKYCLDKLVEIDFPGYAIGGLAIGEKKEDMYRVLNGIKDVLPFNKPRYLMGVGAIDDLLMGVLNGVDMFDCVLPTRNARHGSLFTTDGKVNILNAQFKYDETPIDPKLILKDYNYSKSYVRHLYKAKEMFGYRIVSLQNLYYIKNLMKDVRQSILEDRYLDFIESIKKTTNYF